jgi:hypothetical protein
VEVGEDSKAHECVEVVWEVELGDGWEVYRFEEVHKVHAQRIASISFLLRFSHAVDREPSASLESTLVGRSSYKPDTHKDPNQRFQLC